MQSLQFTLAILLLLATPGPTNTLLCLSGAAAGLRRSAPLLLAELSGYLCVIMPVAGFAAPLLAAHPQISLALKLTAAGWILLMAHTLWAARGLQTDDQAISFRQVFVTTLLNPKALIVALVMMPQVELGARIPWVAGFALLVVFAGSAWMLAGATLGRLSQTPAAAGLPRRVAAVCLMIFSFGMASSALASMA
ncbi:LysE family translocator [Sinorhizobium psoraleae]|uniref:Threonine transporter RhtB n=1 Tax=Sinorhizobium psoraleae TaxID=520838 RepID=A0ABT4KEV4_9HYPH|nr:threonine transporter RhtB [Sinorhizobium psoraleae]MCZ4090419.1 threonine transporter RhtB [Sinorhizobium psoraleae]